MTDVYLQLRPFQQQWKQAGQPPLYCVALDAERAFDRLQHPVFQTLLQELFTEDEYMIRKYVEHTASLDRIRTRFRRAVMMPWELDSFREYAQNQSRSMNCAVFSDQVLYPVVQRSELQEQVREHVMHNIVQVGRGV